MTTATLSPRPLTHAPTDTLVLTGRTLRHVTRSFDTIITTAVTPVAIMLLFVFMFSGAVDTGGEAYVDYLLPGILLITIASGVAYTAYRVYQDVQGGIIDRFSSLPIIRSGVLWAHVLTSLIANFVSLVLVVGVALLVGFRSDASPLGWLAVAGLLGLVTLTLTWLAVIAGLLAKSPDGAGAFSYPLIFLPFVSSAFVPIETLSGPIRWFAEHQPMTSIVETIRDLLGNRAVGGDIWTALAWCLGALVLAYVGALLAYRRRVR